MYHSSAGRSLRTFVRQHNDLLLVLAATLITIPLALLTEGPVRVVFAIPFIIFMPGYCLIAALYPRRDSIDIHERLALSFGTSIAVVPLLSLFLNYTPWGIRLVSVLVTLSSFIIATCIIAALRRHHLYPEERHTINLTLPGMNRQADSQTSRLLTVALITSILFAVGTLIYVVATPKTGEQFTEFYILGADGLAEGYPTKMRVEEPVELILGVVNREGESQVYVIEARLDGQTTGVRLGVDEIAGTQIAPNSFVLVPLDDEEKWEHPITVEALDIGERLKLEFLLFSPRPRDGYHLRALLTDDGSASIELNESKGRATVTLQAGGDTDHNCRVEAWQKLQLMAAEEVQVKAGQEHEFAFTYPPGETVFRLYDGGVLVLEDAGNELGLHLWVESTRD